MSSLDHLIKKLAGASPSVADKSQTMPKEDGVDKTNPVYVEKLASAVDFIVDNISTEKTASPVDTGSEEVAEVEEVSDISSRLRSSLQSRLKEKTAASTTEISAEDRALIDNVLSRIQGMKASTNMETAPEAAEDNIEEIYGNEEETVSNEADGEAAEKAASADLSLADVLNAALGTEEQTTDSDSVVDDEVAKTANVQSSNGLNARKDVTNILKEKLMAKIGGEEAQS